jgi:uncharacterized protein (TIGR02246 family)
MVGSNRMSWVAAAASLLMAMTGISQAASPDEAAIRAQAAAWEKAYNGGDAKGVAALYAEDAMLMPPGTAALNGRAAIQDYFTKDVAASKAAGAVFALNPKTDVGVSGNMGWESGVYKVTVKGAIVETGKFLSVSQKKDGKWLYIRDTWNADAPPAPAAAALPAPAAPAAPPPAPAPKK